MGVTQGEGHRRTWMADMGFAILGAAAHGLTHTLRTAHRPAAAAEAAGRGRHRASRRRIAAAVVAHLGEARSRRRHTRAGAHQRLLVRMSTGTTWWAAVLVPASS